MAVLRIIAKSGPGLTFPEYVEKRNEMPFKKVSFSRFSKCESATLLENSTAARPGSNDLHLALYS